MENSRRVFLCVPTFKEPSKVLAFLQALNFIKYRPITVLIANANPGDQSESIIYEKSKLVDYDLRQVDGISSEYWSGTINRALTVALQESNDDDLLVIMNIDIQFESDVINQLINNIDMLGCSQVAAICHNNGRVISSGVIVRSWFAGINRHPMAGYYLSDIPSNYSIEVNFLPTRCLMVPISEVKRNGIMLDKSLPHYGADYEFTRRLALNGCPAYLLGNVNVECDISNTGASVFDRADTIFQRLNSCTSIKNPSNLRYRLRFITCTYPWWARPTAMCSYIIRTFLEVIFGGVILRRLFPGKERGFS
jgi:GT2 family glycosyltransferase